MNERLQFTFYRSFWDAVQGLPKKDRLPLLEAIISYALDGIEPNALSQTQSAFFLLCKPTLDASRKKAVNGKQGGSKPKANGKQNASEKENEKEEEKENENEYECIKDGKPPAPARRKYGTYGWVRLTDDEMLRLQDDLGEEEFQRCLTYVDESAQTSGNRNKWKDWNLVIRKCSREGWGKSNWQRSGKSQTSTGPRKLDDDEHAALAALMEE